MGDVAMTAAAVREFAAAYPSCHFIMVSRPLFAPLFEGQENVSFVAADFKTTYRGIPGLWKLFGLLRSLRPDVVADLHGVLRTHLLSLWFRLYGYPVKKLRKGRGEKRGLTRRKHKKMQALKSMIDRYFDVLSAAVSAQQPAFFQPSALPPFTAHPVAGVRRIGIAPFAKYKEKIYPPERMEKVVAHFARQEHTEVYLFGGGKEEVRQLAVWEDKYANVQSLAGKLPLSEELLQLGKMDVVVSMDSANMHLASFMGVPVVSVWGATHPYAGFGGWRQSAQGNVQSDLYCRPCSVFGDKPCYRKDYACMNIPEQVIIDKITKVLHGE